MYFRTFFMIRKKKGQTIFDFEICKILIIAAFGYSIMKHSKWYKKYSPLQKNQPRNFTVRRFGYSNHRPHRIMKQMIHHWKALIQNYLKLKQNWAWQHFKGLPRPLLKKVTLSVKRAWLLSFELFFNFYFPSVLPLLRAFKRGI